MIFDRASTEGAIGESPSSPSYDTSLRVLGLPTGRRASDDRLSRYRRESRIISIVRSVH